MQHLEIITNYKESSSNTILSSLKVVQLQKCYYQLAKQNHPYRQQPQQAMESSQQLTNGIKSRKNTMAMTTMEVEGTELRALWAGDCNADGMISYRGEKNDLTILHEEIAGFDMDLNPLFKLDFQLSVGYLQGDVDMNGKAKFDNPDDDKNLVLVTVVLYPLNNKNITNFAHFVEQLP